MAEKRIPIKSKSTVTYLKHFGSDLEAVNAARVSFSKQSNWMCEATKQLSLEDEKLLRYLLKNKHMSPFRHSGITVQIETPFYIARQLVKHDVGAELSGLEINEISRRYVDFGESFFIPSEWRSRPEKSIKQGSGEPLNTVETKICNDLVYDTIEWCWESYQVLLNMGVAPEQARGLLPVATMTTLYATFSLEAALYFVLRRADPHAQKEAQEIAQDLEKLLFLYFPLSTKFYKEFN